MSTRNERFANGTHSLEFAQQDIDEQNCPLYSDHSRGVEHLVSAVDWDPVVYSVEEVAQDMCRLVRYHAARTLVVAQGLGRYLPVLDAVVRNGHFRRRSIRELAIATRRKMPCAARFYYRGVRALLRAISPNKIKGETHVRKTFCQKACTDI